LTSRETHSRAPTITLNTPTRSGAVQWLSTFRSMRNLVFVPAGAASTYYHGFKRIRRCRRRMPQMSHFGTKSGRLSLRIYWSHPRTAADVLALGTQGRRVRLAHLFDAAPPIIVHFGTITLSSRRSPSRYRLLLSTSVSSATRTCCETHDSSPSWWSSGQPHLCITKSETQTRISASVSEGQFRCLAFISTPT
jgi:hypothetical protein